MPDPRKRRVPPAWTSRAFGIPGARAPRPFGHHGPPASWERGRPAPPRHSRASMSSRKRGRESMHSGCTGVPPAWTSRAFGILGARASRPHCHVAGLRPACGRDARAPRIATGAWFRLRRVGVGGLPVAGDLPSGRLARRIARDPRRRSGRRVRRRSRRLAGAPPPCRRPAALPAPRRLAGAPPPCRRPAALPAPRRLAGALPPCRRPAALPAPRRLAGAPPPRGRAGRQRGRPPAASASRSPDERVVGRSSAAATLSPEPYTTTRRRARVTAV